jgi:hypothetical protein
MRVRRTALRNSQCLYGSERIRALSHSSQCSCGCARCDTRERIKCGCVRRARAGGAGVKWVVGTEEQSLRQYAMTGSLLPTAILTFEDVRARFRSRCINACEYRTNGHSEAFAYCAPSVSEQDERR